MKKTLLSLAFGAVAAASFANPFISEYVVNPPGLDNGREAVEIQATPGFNFNGYTLVIIEGELLSLGMGTVDQAISLNGYVAGSNGLLLLRDNSTPFAPAYDPATTVIVNDFVPDFENDSQTWLLVRGPVPAVDTDLDLDDDGVIEPAGVTWTQTVDALSYFDDDGDENGDKGYAQQFGGIDTGEQVGFGTSSNPNYTPDCGYRVLNAAGTAPLAWYVFDLLGTFPGPMTVDPFETNVYVGNPFVKADAGPVSQISIGRKNVSAVSFSGTFTLGDVVSAPAGERRFGITIKDANGNVIGFGNKLANGTEPITILVPAGAGAATVEVDGASFLNRKININVGMTNGSLGTVNMQNGDVDNSGEVDAADIDVTIAEFGQGVSSAADVDISGEVDAADIDIVIANFGGFNQ